MKKGMAIISLLLAVSAVVLAVEDKTHRQWSIGLALCLFPVGFAELTQ